MGGGSSRIKELEALNSRLRRELGELQERLMNSESEMEQIRRDQLETERQLNETREKLLREEENINIRDAELKRLKKLGLERSQYVAMKKQIIEDRQKLMDKMEQQQKERDAAQRRHEQLLEKLFEERDADRKKIMDSMDDLKKCQAELIHAQKTIAADQAARKLMNIVKSAYKSLRQHAKNPLKLTKEMELCQRDLDRQLTEVKSFMDEGYVTIESMTAFADAAVFNIELLDFLRFRGEVDHFAVEAAIEAHREEWQELMSARRRFYPLTDRETPELENVFDDRFRYGNRPILRRLTGSSSFAAISDCSANVLQPSSGTSFAAELEALTVDEVASLPSASGAVEEGPSQDDPGPQTLEQELLRSAVALTTTLEGGLEGGRFDKEGEAHKDQAVGTGGVLIFPPDRDVQSMSHQQPVLDDQPVFPGSSDWTRCDAIAQSLREAIYEDQPHLPSSDNDDDD